MTILDDVVTELDLDDAESWPDWYLRRLLASGNLTALTAAKWNPLLHPRGPDGRFILKFGWVRWFDTDKKTWRTGYVRDIDGTDGRVSVRESVTGKDVDFTADAARKKLYSRPKPKARLKLPNLGKQGDGDGFTKVGPQGGSNPGGLFQVDQPMKSKAPVLNAQATLDLFTEVDMSTPVPWTTDAAAALPASSPHSVLAVRNPDQPDLYDIYFNKNGNWWKVPNDDIPLYGPNGELSDEHRVGGINDVIGAPDSDRRAQLEQFDNDDPPSIFLAVAMDEIDPAELAGLTQSHGASELDLGDQLYVKKTSDGNAADRAQNEALANMLYEFTGTAVPEVMVGDDGETIASKIVTAGKFDIDNPEHRAAARQNFLFDAWLANWDAIGTGGGGSKGSPGGDNMKVDADGRVWRIDAGGALRYRAMGSPKGELFGDHVGELTTFRDGKHKIPSMVYGDVTDAELAEQMDRLAAISADDIRKLVAAHHQPDWLADRLIARRQDIFDQLGYQEVLADGTYVPDIPEPEAPPQVWNPITNEFQPGTPPTAAIDNYGWTIDNLPTVTAPLDAEFRYRPFVYDGYVLMMQPGTDQIDPEGALFKVLDVATGYPPPDFQSVNMEWGEDIRYLVDPDGQPFDTDSPYFDEIQQLLTQKRDLAVAEFVEINRKLTPTELMTLSLYGTGDNPKALPVDMQVLSIDEIPWALNNKIPLYSDQHGIVEIVDVSDSTVALRKADGSIISVDRGTFHEADQWFAPHGVLEPLWRAHIEDRNTKLAADKAAAPQPTPTPNPPSVADQVPDVPLPAGTPDYDNTPDPLKEPEPVKPPVVIDSPVHPDLKPIGKEVTFTEYTDKVTDEVAAELTSEWAGRTVFIAKEGWTPENTADFEPKDVKGVFEVVEIVRNYQNRLVVRGKDANGNIKGFYLTGNPGWKTQYPQTAITEIDVDLQPFKVTRKKNGDLTIGDVVIGKHNWNEVTIFPEYSITGTQHTAYVKKSQMGDYAARMVLPSKVPGKAIKKTPETIALEKGYKKAPQATGADAPYALADGTPAVKGTKVWGIAGDATTVGRVFTIEGTYGKNELIVKDSDGELRYVRATFVISQPPEGQNWLISSHAVKDSEGSWYGPGYKVEMPGGSGTVLAAYPKDGTVLVKNPDGFHDVLDAASLKKTADMPKNLEVLYTADDFTALATDLAKPKPKKQKIGASTYTAPDGGTIPKNQAAVDSALSKGWKLTQDGYSPQPGMVLRRNDGSRWIVKETISYGSQEGKIRVFPENGSSWDDKVLTPSSFQVDHEAMLTDADGNLLPKVKTLVGVPDSAQPIPHGSTIWHRVVTKNGQRGEAYDVYYAQLPNGTVVDLATGKSTSVPYDAKRVAFVDETSGTKKITLQTGSGSISGFAITDIGTDGNKVLADAAAAKAGDSPLAPIPYTGKDPDSVRITGGPVTSTSPPVPEPTITDGSHLHTVGDAPAGASSITDAVARTVRLANDPDGGEWTTSFGIADGDVIEDMQVATQLVDDKGQRYVEVRFRLDGHAADKIRAQLNGETTEYGDWEATPTLTTDLVDGDMISVRVGHGGWLKPSPTTAGTAPNATIVGQPEMLGTAPSGNNLYRFKVALANGDVGYVNIEDRGTPSVSTLSWDGDKPRVKPAGWFGLSGTASNAGWSVVNENPGFEHNKAKLVNNFSLDEHGVKQVAGDWMSSGGSGRVFGRDVEGAQVHLTVTETGRNVQNGRVTIRVPVDDPDVALKVARAMETVGVTPEAQQPPSKEKLAKMALNKIHAQFVETYTRGESTTATLGNPQAALSMIDKAVGKELGRKATLDDIEFQVLRDGQMRVRVSKDVATAIVKKNKATHYVHGAGTGKSMQDALLGRTTGMLSAQQRAANGVFKSNAGTISSDNINGGGDRVFMEARTSATVSHSTYGLRGVIVDPIEMHRNLDYWYRSHDSFGRRFGDYGEGEDTGDNWQFLKLHHAGAGDRNEFLVKNGVPVEMWAGVIVADKLEKDALIKMMTDAGKTPPNGMSWDNFIHIGNGAPVGDIIGSTPEIGNNFTLGQMI